MIRGRIALKFFCFKIIFVTFDFFFFFCNLNRIYMYVQTIEDRDYENLKNRLSHNDCVSTWTQAPPLSLCVIKIHG